MLTTAHVSPLLMPEPRVDLSKFKPSKETALAFNRSAIFVLIVDPRRTQELEIVDAFRFDTLRADATDATVRWTLRNRSGKYWDGAMQELAIYRDQVLLRPANPIMTRVTPWGPRVVFKFRLPPCYRVMHLAQLHRAYPHTQGAFSELL